MLCQEEFRTFQIVFIPGIFCHLLDQELLSYPLLCSPIKTACFWAEAHFLTDQQQLYSFGIMKKTAAVDGMESGSAILTVVQY